jgi:hypothetical protein
MKKSFCLLEAQMENWNVGLQYKIIGSSTVIDIICISINNKKKENKNWYKEQSYWKNGIENKKNASVVDTKKFIGILTNWQPWCLTTNCKEKDFFWRWGINQV